jgi:hypothetical protein
MNQQDQSSETPLGKGVILAVNCVGEDVDPNIKAFWEHATERLAERGFVLIVATSTPLTSDRINTVNFLFDLTQYARRYPQYFDTAQPPVDAAQAERVMSWYRCSQDEAVRSLIVARRFYLDLIETVRPAAVIGWQSMNPGTRLLFDAANHRDIPVWCAERGWVRDTLMIDLGQNNFLSEMHRSFAVSRLFERYPFDAQAYAQLESRKLGANRVGRYNSSDFVDNETFRAQLDIPRDAKVVAFFVHGEPSLHRSAGSVLADMHRTSKEYLQRQIDEISEYCIARGIYLLVQHHPFNKPYGYTLRLANSPYVKEVSVNIHTLLNAADRCLFTFSTIQLDAVFQRKAFGLLSRSALDIENGAYCAQNYASPSAFMDALMNAGDWHARLTQLQRFVLFIYENFLLEITPDRVGESAARFAAQLSKFERPIDAKFPERIEYFLGKWGV